MDRQNIAYIVWGTRQPFDNYLTIGMALLQTYFTPPFGNYTVVPANTFWEVLQH
jgi:hypothetical protein